MAELNPKVLAASERIKEVCEGLKVASPFEKPAMFRELKSLMNVLQDEARLIAESPTSEPWEKLAYGTLVQMYQDVIGPCLEKSAGRLH